MNDHLQRGIDALKAGHKEQARQLLEQVVEKDPWSVQGWLWLSGAVESDAERMRCLNRVLQIDPQNPTALQGVVKLRRARMQQAQPSPTEDEPADEKDVYIPTPGLRDEVLNLTRQPSTSAITASGVPDDTVKSTATALNRAAPQDRWATKKDEALEGFRSLIEYDLADGKSAEEIIERLSTRGFKREYVARLVNDIQGDVQNLNRHILRESLGQVKTRGPFPWWAALFILGCVLMPVLYGFKVEPISFAVIGTLFIVSIARDASLPTGKRVLRCTIALVASWVLLILFILFFGTLLAMLHILFN